MSEIIFKTVKDSFKNAKTVKCLSSGNIFDIDVNSIIESSYGNYWCDEINKASKVKVFSIKHFNYAEIIEYKKNKTK